MSAAVASGAPPLYRAPSSSRGASPREGSAAYASSGDEGRLGAGASPAHPRTHVNHYSFDHRRGQQEGASDGEGAAHSSRAATPRESHSRQRAASEASTGSNGGVVDFLFQAGKRYEQRLHLLRQEKIAVEMSHLTGKPTISPFAEELYNSRAQLRQRLGHGGAAEETVQARLHRLHERKLEREKEKLAKYTAQQEAKEMEGVTHAPRITEAAQRLAHRGSQAAITAKWLEERRAKTARLHEASLYREMAEVQPIPMISPYSAQIVHSGASSFYGTAGGGREGSSTAATDQSRREAAGSVGEYLLAREKERRQRLKALREARDRLESSTFRPVISAKAHALQMGDVTARLSQPKRTPLDRYIAATTASANANAADGADGDAYSSGVGSDDVSGDDGSDAFESDYEEAEDEEGNLIIVRVERPRPRRRLRVRSASSNVNDSSTVNNKKGAPTVEAAKAAFDKVFNPECTFRPYVSEASRLLVEQRERRQREEKEKEAAATATSGGDGEGTVGSSPSPARSQRGERRQRSGSANVSVSNANADPSKDPAYRKAYPSHTFKPTISETSRQLALRRQEAHEAAKLRGEQQQQRGEGEGGDGDVQQQEVMSPSSRLHAGLGRRPRRHSSGPSSSSAANSSRLNTSQLSSVVGTTAAKGKRAGGGGHSGHTVHTSTELSVNRHLRLLPDDDDEGEEGAAVEEEDDEMDVGSDADWASNDDGTPQKRRQRRQQQQQRGGGDNGRSASVATYASSSAALGSTTNTSGREYGKPMINANSRRMAEAQRNRMRAELLRERKNAAAAAADGAANGYYRSGAGEGEGDEALSGAEEYHRHHHRHHHHNRTASGDVDSAATDATTEESLSAHDLLYHAAARRREAKERRVAAELAARQAAEDARCTFTPQRDFGAARRYQNRINNQNQQHHQGYGHGYGEDGEGVDTPPERRRLVMTREGSDAFAQKNAQWLRRREQALKALKASEGDRDMDECTFRPRVHDQVPLPIGASANAPGVDSFLERQRGARQLRAEEERRRSALGGSTAGVDKRPIGGVTQPKPFVLGKERERRLLHARGGRDGAWADGGPAPPAPAYGRAHSAGLNYSNAHQHTTSNTHRDPNAGGASFTADGSGGHPSASYASHQQHHQQQQLTRSEWAEIREQMLAPEGAVGSAHQHHQGQGRPQQHPQQQQMQTRPKGPSTSAAAVREPHMAEFSQHPSALVAAGTVGVGVAGNAGANALASNYRGGAAPPPSRGGGGGNGGGNSDLFGDSPIDFVLNNHSDIARQFQMRQ